MLNRNHYRTVANALMIIFIAFVVMDFAGQPIIERFQIFYVSKRAMGRFDSLRADMDSSEVWAALRLRGHKGGVTLGSGPPEYYMAVTDLGYGHHLRIVRNVAANPPRLISVSVDDKTWKPQDHQTIR